MSEPSNNQINRGNNNHSIQDVKDSTIYIGAVPPSGSTLPKELTLNIPRTDPQSLVGREHTLEELHQLLSEAQASGVVVVNGIGGIGKTTLAQAYVSKYYDHYQHIAWITQTGENITGDFLNTAGLLRTLQVKAEGLEPQQLFEEVVLSMKCIEQKPNLLVIDNAELSLSQYRNLLPGSPKWHLLVTSRAEIESFTCKQLDFLSEDQAVQLFQKHFQPLKTISEQEIKELVRAVDYHTLTIEILAKTAKVQRYSAEKLKGAIEEDLRANVPVAREDGKVEKVGSYLNTVFNLSKLSETEGWVLKQFCCLPSEFHTYTLLRELVISEEGPYAEVFSETLVNLAQKGWLLYNGEADSYKLHRIIVDVTRKQHPITLEEVKCLVDAVAEKLEIDQNKDNPADKLIWVPFGKTAQDGINHNNSNTIANLKNNLAIVLKELGQYKEAKHLFEQTVKIAEKNYGENNIITANCYSNLSLVLRLLDEYEEAKHLMQKAVLIYEQRLEADHPSIASAYSNLAGALQDLGEYEKAKTLMIKVVQMVEKKYGENHPKTARAYSNFASVLRSMGEPENAKDLFQKAVQITERHFGEHHPTTAKTYINLAITLQNLGELENAKGLFQKAAQINEQHFGEHHPLTISTYSNLATVFQDLLQQEEAKLVEKSKNFNKSETDKI